MDSLKPSEEKPSQNKALEDLTRSVALLPEFIIDPLKEYIRNEIACGVSYELEKIVAKKIEPEQKKHSLQHLMIMVLLASLLAFLVLNRIL